MKFNNICEEEQLFPYEGISLKESRMIRYLLSNMPIFENGRIVQMSLKEMGNFINANGLFAGNINDNQNMSFDSYVYRQENGYMVLSTINGILSHKERYSIDEFICEDKNIQVKSKIEYKKPSCKRISYPEEEITRK